MIIRKLDCLRSPGSKVGRLASNSKETGGDGQSADMYCTGKVLDPVGPRVSEIPDEDKDFNLLIRF